MLLARPNVVAVRLGSPLIERAAELMLMRSRYKQTNSRTRNQTRRRETLATTQSSSDDVGISTPTLVCTFITVPTRPARITSLAICLSNFLFASDLTPPWLSRTCVLRGNRQTRLCHGDCAFCKANYLFAIYCLLTLPLHHREISFYGYCGLGSYAGRHRRSARLRCEFG